MSRWLLLMTLVGACMDPSVGALDEQQARAVTYTFTASPAAQLDVLFVVDDAPAMAPLQDHLATGFQQIASNLDGLARGGAPDLHVGVITGDLCTRSAPTIPYFTDRMHAGKRLRSYTGTLAEALGVLAEVGAAGCDRQELLEAMRRALASPANQGFLREHALLQVVFITDEDDQSDDEPAAYARYLNALKPPGLVMVTGVDGPCTTPAWSAAPAPRLQTVVAQVGPFGTTLPICSEDLEEAVCVVERFEPERPGTQCLYEPLADPSGCSFSDVQHLGHASQTEQVLPACDASGRVPCWHVVDAPGECNDGRAFRIERGDLEIPFDDEVVGDCVTM